MIDRHFVNIGDRRVHYRKAGSGPPLLMVHQSPRSSAEYEPLMARWAEYFTCLAPDTPGFGQSDPLPGDPDIGDFSAALIAFLDALGIDRTAAYGFHSGGIILIGAIKRYPDRFATLVTGGYAVWTPEERAIFDKNYLPAFRPSAYGEHLTWVWNRILEQTWFFPWFDVNDSARLSVAHDDPVRVDAVVRDMLDSGDAYRAGYGAVLRAPREIPASDFESPPVLIVAYDGDPLQAHLARLGTLPESWSARAVKTPADLEAASLAHIRATPLPDYRNLAERADEGFTRISEAGFDGLIHWRGIRDAATIMLHAPGREAELVAEDQSLAIDLPGHGLSDDWGGERPRTLAAWGAVVAAALREIRTAEAPVIIGEGLSALLAGEVAARLGSPGWGAVAAHVPLLDKAGSWADRALPSIEPDRFGGYLTAAWSAVRAAHFYWPWFDAGAANAIPFEQGDIAPDSLAREHRAMIRATAGRALLAALLDVDRAALVADAPPVTRWEVAKWARMRTDIWKPEASCKEKIMGFREEMPLLTRHEGVWDGVYTYFDRDGKQTDTHTSRLLCRVKDGDAFPYHQTNFYTWLDGRTETRDFPASYKDHRIWWDNDLIKGWAAEVGLDEKNRTVMLYWQRQGDPSLYLYEMIQIADDGKSRCRTWHWIRDGQLETRTAIQEVLVTRDWASVEKEMEAQAD